MISPQVLKDEVQFIRKQLDELVELYEWAHSIGLAPAHHFTDPDCDYRDPTVGAILNPTQAQARSACKVTTKKITTAASQINGALASLLDATEDDGGTSSPTFAASISKAEYEEALAYQRKRKTLSRVRGEE